MDLTNCFTILLRWLTFLLGSLTVAPSPALFDCFFLTPVCFAVASIALGNSMLCQLLLNFFQTQKGIALFIAQLVNIFALVGTDFVIIWEMFCGMISLNSVAGTHFISRSWLELMYLSLIENMRSSIFHFHGFWPLVLLSQLIEITYIVCTSGINLYYRWNLGWQVIVVKTLLKLPNLLMFILDKDYHSQETWLS